MNDNRETITLFEKEYEIEASLGAATIYRNEFGNNVNETYTGSLTDDIVRLYKQAEEDENPYLDCNKLLEIVWSMGRAAGSIKKDYKKFISEMQHKPLNTYEFANVYNAIVRELGDRVFFRIPKGQNNSEQSNEAEEGGRSSSDS